MKSESPDLAPLLDAIGALRQEVSRLTERVAALESSNAPALAPQVPAPAMAPAAKSPEPEPLSEELVIVIGAAVAAFLGKRAHVRQIRLLGSAVWSQEGRITIQASHRLAGRN